MWVMELRLVFFVLMVIATMLVSVTVLLAQQCAVTDLSGVLVSNSKNEIHGQ
jgi:hypothetical protein